ncbi:MAG TPA: AAA family ATPase [Phycisphaerae bacterium]|nr:AAA family ATPase [Phycisphaerae bacterium]
MTLVEVANELKDDRASIILVYAFNATGKTQLCVTYKDVTKLADGSHSGVYYNAYSEDIFVWDNDEENDGANIRLTVRPSSLSKFHSSLNEDDVREKLNAYKPKYDFEFTMHENPEKGIEAISFFLPTTDPNVDLPSIKISRGEERIFVWCFFLAMFEVEGWANKQSSHFFIDDPVSSLDDYNIFITASTLFNLIETHYKKRKIILTTHHIGIFSILSDWLMKGEKSDTFKTVTKLHILSDKSGELSLENCRHDVMLYHLRLLQVLVKANKANDIRSYHFALLRQILENVASFLGVGQFGYVLREIGIDDPEEVANIINTLSHKKVYYYESDFVVPDNQRTFANILNKLQNKYNFKLHTE